MTEEQKQLLLKDLCGRLPYGVNILHVNDGIIGVLSTVNFYLGSNAEGKQELKCVTSFFGEDNVPIEEFKPYLYPLSSMTEEQKGEIDNYFNSIEGQLVGIKGRMIYLTDFFNKNHFDYRGLIKEELAIDATGIIMYNKEERP